MSNHSAATIPCGHKCSKIKEYKTTSQIIFGWDRFSSASSLLLIIAFIVWSVAFFLAFETSVLVDLDHNEDHTGHGDHVDHPGHEDHTGHEDHEDHTGHEDHEDHTGHDEHEEHIGYMDQEFHGERIYPKPNINHRNPRGDNQDVHIDVSQEKINYYAHLNSLNSY